MAKTPVEYAKDIHEFLESRGFWQIYDEMKDRPQVRREQRISKLHLYLSKAVDEHLHGAPMLYVDDITLEHPLTNMAEFDGRCPEGAYAYLARFILGMMDYVYGYDYPLGYDAAREVIKPLNKLAKCDFSTLICELHKRLSILCYTNNRVLPRTAYGECIVLIERWCAYRECRIWDVVDVVLKYELTRGGRFGEQY